MRNAVSSVCNRLSVWLRRKAGNMYPVGHPLRTFHHTVAEIEEEAVQDYLKNEA